MTTYTPEQTARIAEWVKADATESALYSLYRDCKNDFSRGQIYSAWLTVYDYTASIFKELHNQLKYDEIVSHSPRYAERETK